MNQEKIGEAGDLPRFDIKPVESEQLDDPPSSASSCVSHFDERSQTIEQQFTFHGVIGQGGFSKVKKAIKKTTGDVYAVKILDKTKIQEGEFPRVILEIETLGSVKHPCICSLYSAFYTHTKIYMVMEYCYTDLFDYLVKLLKPMPEGKAWKIFVQLLAAVSYLHSVGIVHRDIKPENILLTGDMKIKLSDFGFAAKIPRERSRLLSTYCGSVAYGAPEILQGIPYSGEKADIWSLGVNLYVLLTNRQPFWSKKPNEIRTQVMTGAYQLTSHFNKRTRNLIMKLLQVYPQRRASIREIWEDPWILQRNPEELFKQLGYNISTKYPYISSSSPETPEVLAAQSPQQHYKPTCRNDPVQVEISSHRTRLRVFISFVRRRLINLRDIMLCRKISC